MAAHGARACAGEALGAAAATSNQDPGAKLPDAALREAGNRKLLQGAFQPESCAYVSLHEAMRTHCCADNSCGGCSHIQPRPLHLGGGASLSWTSAEVTTSLTDCEARVVPRAGSR